MYLIVGLGNPGEQYRGTRHNLGFEVADKLGAKGEGKEKGWKYQQGLKSEILQLDPSLILAKPRTYMNNSGLAVKLLADYYKIAPEEIIAIHDELDLPLGKIKIRSGGAAAGHHGVESIIGALGTDKFVRVRLGIGPESGRAILSEHKADSFNVEKFVLEQFVPGERARVKQLIKHAEVAVETILKKGLAKAQNEYN